jgi:mannose-6-phosphate isomerase
MIDPIYYPLRLKPWAREMLWGGRNLEWSLGKRLPASKMIGETWEAWDGNTITNGRHRGLTLSRLIEIDLIGTLGSVAAPQKKCPLLFKFIDAQDDLSLQVHPDDAAAQALDNYPFGKTEAWYVLHAEPDARLIHGFNIDVTPDVIAQYLSQDRLMELVSSVPVERGDVVLVPPGTVHAIGKGIVLAEIQENSDLTYRMYDWGRKMADGKSRVLHIAKSLQVANLHRVGDHKIPPLVIHSPKYDHHYLAACRYFSLELLDVRDAVDHFRLGGKFNIISVIEGEVDISFGDHLESCVPANQGQTVFLPAGLGEFGTRPRKLPCKILRAYVPNLRADIVEPLVRAGFDASSISQLGGSSQRSNDLLRLV